MKGDLTDVQPVGTKRKGTNQVLKDGVEVKTAVFVPSTRGGVLVRRLRESEETLANITGFGINFQEAGGTQLMNMFETNLGKGLHCARTPCPPCDTHTEGRDHCRARNVVYESVCLKCSPISSKKDTQQDGVARGRKGVYVGNQSLPP